MLITLLTHESELKVLHSMAQALMRGVAGLLTADIGIKGQFYGNHTSNCATVVLTNVTPTTNTTLPDALLCAYKDALATAAPPVYQKLVHDVLFLPSGHSVRYEGRVGEATEQPPRMSP